MQLPVTITGELGEDAKASTQVFVLLALNETACELGKGFFYHGTSTASPTVSGMDVTEIGSTLAYGDIFYVGIAWIEAKQEEFRSMSNAQRLAMALLCNGDLWPHTPLIGITLLPKTWERTQWSYAVDGAPEDFRIGRKAGVLLYYDTEPTKIGIPVLVETAFIEGNPGFEAGDKGLETGLTKTIVVSGNAEQRQATWRSFSLQWRCRDHVELLERMWSLYFNPERAPYVLEFFDDIIDDVTKAPSI